ncbi:MAG: hypothetical protein ACXWZS_13450 [Gemmatirosa sp.]
MSLASSHAIPRRAAARLLLALALGGCAGLFGRSPDDRAITIDLPIPRDEAVRRTLATFRIQGYQVKETLTSGTTPETEPFAHGDDAEAVFRAEITGTGRESRVVLTGTYRRRQLAGIVRGREREVRRTDDPLERELWDRLANLGLVIRRPGR